MEQITTLLAWKYHGKIMIVAGLCQCMHLAEEMLASLLNWAAYSDVRTSWTDLVCRPLRLSAAPVDPIGYFIRHHWMPRPSNACSFPGGPTSGQSEAKQAYLVYSEGMPGRLTTTKALDWLSCACPTWSSVSMA